MRQILALAAGDIGDRAQHDRGREGQFDRQPGKAQGAARRPRYNHDGLVEPARVAHRPPVQASKRETKRALDRRLRRPIDKFRKMRRNNGPNEADLLTKDRGEAHGETGALEQTDRALQGELILGRKLLTPRFGRSGRRRRVSRSSGSSTACLAIGRWVKRRLNCFASTRRQSAVDKVKRFPPSLVQSGNRSCPN